MDSLGAFPTMALYSYVSKAWGSAFCTQAGAPGMQGDGAFLKQSNALRIDVVQNRTALRLGSSDNADIATRRPDLVSTSQRRHKVMKMCF